MFWLVLNRSFIVLISLSTFPLPLWSFIGHLMCLIKDFPQKFLNSLLVNAVPGSVLICLGIPLSAMYLCKNSITLCVVGALNYFASCQPVLLSIETIKYFWNFLLF